MFTIDNKDMTNIALLIITILLSACNPFALYKPNSQKIVKRGWAKKDYVPLPELYCYKTLGEPLCYKEPLHGVEERLHGFYDVTTNEVILSEWEEEDDIL